MSTFPALKNLIDQFCSSRPVRAGSLIITMYGDALTPRGGTVWLGSLINLLGPLGLNERSIRTSVFRLVKENWLMSEQVGRRSYYSLTGPGMRRFQKAFRQVYAQHNPEWDGRWIMAILSQLSVGERNKLRQELEWHGFGLLSPTVLLHPQIPLAELQIILQELNAQDNVIIFEDISEGRPATRALRRQALESWNLPKLAEDYQSFLKKYRPVWDHLKVETSPTPEQCFQIRLLLIHDYRRIILRDPQLPDELLPGDWAGNAARQLCSNIYHRVWEGAENHMNQYLETAEGPLPAPNAKFYQRYGGLK